MNAAPPVARSCCRMRKRLAEQFAIAARLYAESVVRLATEPVLTTLNYERLVETLENEQRRPESAGAAYEEHLDTHRCDGQNRSESPRPKLRKPSAA